MTAPRQISIMSLGDIELVGDLYVPDREGSFPVVFEITPYDARELAKAGSIYASRGFVFLAVDCRGRYRSAGEWHPVQFDQADGHAVIEWLVAQPFCNGRIGTRGYSYSGFNQILTAVDAPAALQAAVVLSAPGDAFDNVPYRGGAYDIQDLLWLRQVTGRVSEQDLGNEEWGAARFGAWSEENQPEPHYSYELTAPAEAEPDPDPPEELIAALSERPFSDVDLRLGARMPVFREWLAHPSRDAFWAARSAAHRIHQTRVPTLHIAGWWDENAGGAAHFYRAMRERAATAESRDAQRILLGPWTHAYEAPDLRDMPATASAAIRRAADYDTLNDELAFFDHHLLDIPTGPTSLNRARVFVTGENRWRNFDDWPPTATQERDFFLSDGALGDEAGPPRTTSVTLRQNDPTPHGRLWAAGRPRPYDNSSACERDDIACFETTPFQTPFKALGPVHASIFASADRPTFDLVVRVLDLHPDGRAIWLADGIRRATYTGDASVRRVVPGDIYDLKIDLFHLGHVFQPGHRLRVEIAPAAFMRWDINPGSANGFETEDADDIEVTIYSGPSHPSTLTLFEWQDPE